MYVEQRDTTGQSPFSIGLLVLTQIVKLTQKTITEDENMIQSYRLVAVVGYIDER